LSTELTRAGGGRLRSGFGVHEVALPDQREGAQRAGEGDDRAHEQQVVEAAGEGAQGHLPNVSPRGRGDVRDGSPGVG